MSQRTATSDSDVPFEARFARSNGNSSDPNYASGLRSLSAKHSRHDPSLTSAPIPSSSTPVSSSLPPTTLGAAGPTSLPDFGSAYETFDRRAQAYNPDPYHFYRHPPAVPSGRQSTGFPCRSNGSEFNNPPHMYHSQFAPHLPQHHSQSASSISSGYSGSPFDSAHSRRFRPGSTPGTDRQTPPYQINPMYSGDMPHMYSSADNAYARYLTDPPVHSRPEVSNLLAPSHGPGFTEVSIQFIDHTSACICTRLFHFRNLYSSFPHALSRIFDSISSSVCLLVRLLSPSATYLVSRAERIRVLPPLVFPGLSITIIFMIISIITEIHLLSRLHSTGMHGTGQPPTTRVVPK